LSCLLFDIAIDPLRELLRKSNLKGYQIPGYAERLIATFFTDNPTVYLSKEDDFGELQLILDEWCTASGARFNINKTEIIPIGSPDHQENMRQTWLMNGEDGSQTPDHIKIAQESEAIWTLGALIRNGISQVEPSTKVIEKIDQSLARWDRSKPTMEGQHLIISMIVGGMTQYLTKVQGMLKEVEIKLTKKELKNSYRMENLTSESMPKQLKHPSKMEADKK
ncbi:hypothetical protein F5877DRAFT_43399, partial [Lentinula edodes]